MGEIRSKRCEGVGITCGMRAPSARRAADASAADCALSAEMSLIPLCSASNSASFLSITIKVPD